MLSRSLSARLSEDVRTAMRVSGVTADDIASEVHLSVWTVRARLAGRSPWTDEEARAVSRLLASPPRRGRGPVWLRASQVAALFGVDRRSVARWAESGRLPAARTDGGHWRFRADVVAERLSSAGYMAAGRGSGPPDRLRAGQ